MQYLQNTSTKLLENEKSELEQAIETICEAKQDLNDDWAKEAFDFVAMALKEKEGMQ